ncbi:MAG: hypothetical protein IIB62_10865, partial [Proteobacteria bacterium]|nr:hypothetical protein [Pseudomonadota bacterium]
LWAAGSKTPFSELSLWYLLYWFTTLFVACGGDDVAVIIPYRGIDYYTMNYEGVRVEAFEFIHAGLIVNDPKYLPWLLRPRRVFQLFQPALSLSRVASHIL